MVKELPGRIIGGIRSSIESRVARFRVGYGVADAPSFVAFVAQGSLIDRYGSARSQWQKWATGFSEYYADLEPERQQEVFSDITTRLTPRHQGIMLEMLWYFGPEEDVEWRQRLLQHLWDHHASAMQNGDEHPLRYHLRSCSEIPRHIKLLVMPEIVVEEEKAKKESDERFAKNMEAIKLKQKEE